jgi:O-acetyl-ADP-ribose deacetylase (regulator of RNase III)
MITYIKGDATEPIGDGKKFILHVCNCNNGWGRGFVLSISKKWSRPEEAFRSLFQKLPKSEWLELLGFIQVVKVEKDTFVINMIAQKGYGKNNQNQHKTEESDTEIPLQYDALKQCLENVAGYIKYDDVKSIHAPRFGAGLAGGDWKIIEQMIEDIFCKNGIQVYVYDL